MARTSRKNRLEYCRSELDRARNFRETQGYDLLWERMTDLYRGRSLPQVETVEDQIVVNVAFGTINVIAPSVAVNYPKITVMPTHPLNEETAVITEAVINYNWRHFNYQDQFRLAVNDYLIMGHGWIKVGYRYSEQMVSTTYEERESDYGEMVQQADDYAAENPAMAAEVPDDAEIMAALPDTKIVVAEDQPFVERVSPYDIYVDPEATTMADAKWICQRIVRPLRDVKKDARYKRSVREHVEADMATDRMVEQQRNFFRRATQSPDDQRVTIWEYYDTRGNTIEVFAEGSDEFLIDPQPVPFAFGHPFIMLRNYDVPDYFYPMGDLEAIEPLICELNKTRSISIAVRQKFAPKLMYRQGAFDAAGRQALASNEPYTMVPVADENTPFADVLAPVPQIQVAPELFEHSDVVEKDIGDVSGVSEYQRGQVPETRRTATEAAIISDNVNARSADKLAQIEKSISMVARRVVQLQQQFMTQTQVARVVGPDMSIYWVPYSHEDIEGEFDFEVEAGSTQPMNETARRQQATALLQAMTPFLGTVVDPAAMVQHVLRYGFGIQNAGKFLMPGMPMQPGQPGAEGAGMEGPQGAPMGGGFPDAETGEMGNSMPGGAMEGF